MLMPDRLLALKIAKERLNEGGNIYFLLTLMSKRTKFSEIMGSVKPYLKYLTTVDFGQITFQNEFLDMMEDNKLKINKMEKLTHKWNPFINGVNFFVVETQKLQ